MFSCLEYTTNIPRIGSNITFESNQAKASIRKNQGKTSILVKPVENTFHDKRTLQIFRGHLKS